MAQTYKRKLTAILHADVKGYSRLMGGDEEATVTTLTAHRETMTTLVEKHGGRVVDCAGDSMLAAFASVVNAVSSAVDIQSALKHQNSKLSDERKVEFRIGINLGDVIEKSGNIYGDGVNIAARIEALADAGGICITQSVYDQVKKKLKLGYEFLGEHSVKNISDPVRVYRVQTGSRVAGEKKPATRSRGLAVAAIVIVLLVVGAAGIWNYWPQSATPQSDKSPQDKLTHELTDTPSIAVLPFDNMSDDPKQEYFSDGITEDLITDLSKIAGLFVIARNSTFTYKGKPVKVQQVAEELGVRYVLEGSVRKAGESVRINAQLIDATTGHHLWADRFDGQHKDIFALQDKFTKYIVDALAVRLTKKDQSLLARKDTANVKAYDVYMQGLEFMRNNSPKDLEKAVNSFKKAVELDSEFSRAHTALSQAYTDAMTKGWDMELGWFDASSLAKKHLQLTMKNPTPKVHRQASGKHLFIREYDSAISEAELALALSPNDPESQWVLGRTLVIAGQTVKGMEHIKRAIRLNPNSPGRYSLYLGVSLYLQKQYEEALVPLERAQRLEPAEGSAAYSTAWLPAAYAQLGREQKAAQIVTINTQKRMWRYGSSIFQALNFWPLKKPEDQDHFADGLLRAGLPIPWNPVYRRKYKEAISEAKIRMDAAPDDLKNQAMMADVLIYTGRSEEAIEFITKMMQTYPGHHPYPYFQLGLAQFCTEQYEEAAQNLNTYHKRHPWGLRLWVLAATYAHLGRQEEAENAITQSKLGREYFNFTIERVLRYVNFPFKNQKDTARLVEGLKKAGLPEK